MSTIAEASQQSRDITIKGVTFTNKGNLSQEHAIFAAYHSLLYSGNPPREGKLSTTTIIGPVRKAILAIQYPDTGLQDVAELMASAKGTAMHNGLTAALTEHNSGYRCEQRIEREVNGWKISGEFDVLTPDKQIKDLKFVSNYNIKQLIEDKSQLQPEWTLEDMYIKAPTYFKFVAQLSIYKYLENDPELKPYGSILFSLNNGSDMGKYTIDQEVTFPLRPTEEIEEFLFDRVQQIKDHLANGTIPLCSDVSVGIVLANGNYNAWEPLVRWQLFADPNVIQPRNYLNLSVCLANLVMYLLQSHLSTLFVNIANLNKSVTSMFLQ